MQQHKAGQIQQPAKRADPQGRPKARRLHRQQLPRPGIEGGQQAAGHIVHRQHRHLILRVYFAHAHDDRDHRVAANGQDQIKHGTLHCRAAQTSGTAYFFSACYDSILQRDFPAQKHAESVFLS